METRQPIPTTNRFYVFDRDDTLLDKNNQIINPQFISEFVSEITLAPNVQWAIASRGSMGDVSHDGAYIEIKKLYPEVEKKKPFYPIVTSLNSLLNCAVSVQGLKNQTTDTEAARNSFQALFYKDYEKIQEEGLIDLKNTKWTLQIGHTTVQFSASQFDEEHQKLLVQGDYKLFGVLAALDMAGLKVAVTDELKAFGIVEIKTPVHYQQIEAKDVVFVDDKTVNCELLNHAGFTAIHADTPVLQEKVNKETGEKNAGTVNTYQSKLNETLHITKNMQYYIDALRAGNIFTFLDNAKYINQKYAYLGKLSPETFALLFMYELTKTKINEKDLKLLFNFHLLLGDLEKQSKFMEAKSNSYALKQIHERTETIIAHKKFNPKVFNEIDNLTLASHTDIEKLRNLMGEHKTNQEQITAIMKKNKTPRSRDIDKYKTEREYKNFSSKQTAKIAKSFLENNAEALAKREKDRSILQQMVTNQKSVHSSWLPSFSFFSSQESVIENRELALSNLFKLCNYAKVVCKDIGDEKNLSLLRSIEEPLIEEKSGIAKTPASQKQINEWRDQMIQMLLKISEKEIRVQVKNLSTHDIGSEAFTKELSLLMDARHQGVLTRREKRKEEKHTIERIHAQNQDYDLLLKLQIVGNSGVGKTNLLARYADGLFSDKFITTIGVDFKTVMLNTDNQILNLQLWDSPGHNRFRTMEPTLGIGIHGAIVVCDLTDEISMKEIDGWFSTIAKESGSTVKEIVLLGNKADLLSESQRILAEERLKALAEKHDCKYTIVSAKTGQGVEKAFNQFAIRVKDALAADKSKSEKIEIASNRKRFV